MGARRTPAEPRGPANSTAQQLQGRWAAPRAWLRLWDLSLLPVRETDGESPVTSSERAPEGRDHTPLRQQLSVEVFPDGNQEEKRRFGLWAQEGRGGGLWAWMGGWEKPSQ